MLRLHLLGLNHTTAPLSVREKVAFTPERQCEALERFHALFPDCELVLISTCNRVELYTARPVHGHPRSDEMTRFLAGCHSLSPEAIHPHLYEKTDRDAVLHLFGVASGLDSMVLGETQILGQVREAYEQAKRRSMTSVLLNPLFQRAIAVGREVMSETSLNDGQLSVASIAVNYARGLFDRLDGKTVLAIGAGKMSSLVLRQFAQFDPGRMVVVNRDPENGRRLVERYGGQPAGLDELDELLSEADVVISSTGAPAPIITRARFEALPHRHRDRPIFMIDLALPRDIDPAVGEIDNVHLRNLDDLQQEASKTQSQRSEAVDAARAIVRRRTGAFMTWNRTRELGPSIDRLYRRYHEIAQEEASRTLSKLPEASDEEREHLHELARRIVNKLLHDPIKALREDDDLHGPSAQYLRAMEKLFQIGEAHSASSDTFRSFSDEDERP